MSILESIYRRKMNFPKINGKLILTVEDNPRFIFPLSLDIFLISNICAVCITRRKENNFFVCMSQQTLPVNIFCLVIFLSGTSCLTKQQQNLTAFLKCRLVQGYKGTGKSEEFWTKVCCQLSFIMNIWTIIVLNL